MRPITQAAHHFIDLILQIKEVAPLAESLNQGLLCSFLLALIMGSMLALLWRSVVADTAVGGVSHQPPLVAWPDPRASMESPESPWF